MQPHSGLFIFCAVTTMANLKTLYMKYLIVTAIDMEKLPKAFTVKKSPKVVVTESERIITMK